MKLLYAALHIAGILLLITNVAYPVQTQFNRLSVADGLSNNQINCICKDSRGFMWFGTASGLNRFDGYDFRVYKHRIGDTLSLLDNEVKRIAEDGKGRLWVLSISGYSIYDPYSDSFSQNVPQEFQRMGIRQSVRSVFFDDRGNLWAALNDGGIIRHDFATNRNRFFSRKNSIRQELRIVDLKSKDGKVWLLYGNGDVACIDNASSKVLEVDGRLDRQNSDFEPTTLFVDSKDNIWLSSYSLRDGLAVRFRSSRQWQTINTTTKPMWLTSNMISGIAEDAHGLIWVSTDHGGVCVIDYVGKQVDFLNNDPLEPRSLSDNSATSLYCDDLGIMWIGTYKQGISYTHEGVCKFKAYQYPTAGALENKRNDCNSFYEDAQGCLWVGTNGGGLIRYNRDGSVNQIYTKGSGASSISGDVVVCLTDDSKGRLWVGSYMGGLDCFDGRSFRHFRHDPAKESSVSSNSIYAIHEDPQGAIWIGTLNGGIDRYDESTESFRHYAFRPNLQCKIIDGFDGNLLIATPEGVLHFNKETGCYKPYFLNPTSKKVGSRAFVNDLKIDRKGLLWMATNEGLFVFNSKSGRFINVQHGNEALKENALSLLEDKTGDVWVGTSNGLLCVDIKNADLEGKWQLRVRQFDKADGLQSNLFNANGAFLTASGEIIEGGVSGYSRFYPSRIFYNKRQPEVVFSDFSVLNSSISKEKPAVTRVGLGNGEDSQTIRLRYSERNFAVQFAALSFVHPQKNRYRYILDGFDKQWIATDAVVRKVTYTNLDPGTYLFKVEASNNDGVWNAKPSMLKIVVMPPIWATHFAYLVYAALFAAAIYLLVHHLNERQKKLMLQEQAKFETQRMLALDEMKLQFFTNISHELRTPLTLILSPLNRLQKRLSNEDNKQLVTLTQNNAQRLLNLVNQLLDFRKMDANAQSIDKSVGDIVPFIKSICNEFKEWADRKEIDLRCEIGDCSILLEFDEDKIYKSLSNLLSNALKYTSQGGCVRVGCEVDEHSRMLQISVADNGAGISDADQQHIFERFYQVESSNRNISGTGIGLHLAYEFVKMHGGNLSVEGRVGEGSRFVVSLPMAVSQLKRVEKQPEAEPAIAAEPVVAPDVSRKDERKQTVFIVDDNEEFLRFMVSVFGDDYNVLFANNGKTAWQRIEETLPDIVISDVMMPELDGFELCRLMHTTISTSHIPVVLLTAKDGDESKIEGLESGATDYICKPFNIDILQLKIARILQYRELQRQKFQQKKEILASEVAVNSLDEKLIKKAIDYVEDNIDKAELSVEDLSAHLAMSRAHLYKKMVAIVGKTPIEFIRILRLKRAAQLLEKSQMSVSEVAYSVGFNDPKYFRKYFKDEFAVLPSEYKQRCEAERGSKTISI